jgi:type VI secretion system protein ImpH
VEQFRGEWLSLPPEARTPLGRGVWLGVNCVVGQRVWDVQGQFRVRIGPLAYKQFLSLLPATPGLRALGQMTRAYVGPELDFDVHLVLRARGACVPVGVGGCRSPAPGAEHQAALAPP